MTRLEALRLDAEWSVRDLASAAGVSHQTVHDLEARRTRPHAGTLAAVATALTRQLQTADPKAPAVKPSELLRDVDREVAASPFEGRGSGADGKAKAA